ncbi:MAG: hypothetical protein V9G10_05345 [Candidatus Nanopelagicales bacterium]
MLVYSDSARDNLQASRLEPSVVEKVASAPGVTQAGPISVLTDLGGPQGRQRGPAGLRIPARKARCSPPA